MFSSSQYFTDAAKRAISSLRNSAVTEGSMNAFCAAALRSASIREAGAEAPRGCRGFLST